jgi:PAS domain S-box-containing protein
MSSEANPLTLFSREWSSRPATAPAWLRYSIAAAAVGLATVLMHLLWPHLHATPFILFFPAILLAAWFGGMGPGLFALLLSILSSDYYFLDPHGSLLPQTSAGWLQLGLFVGVSFFIVSLTEGLHRANRHALAEVEERSRAEQAARDAAGQLEAERNRLDGILSSVPGVVWEAWGQPDAASQRINFVSDYVETMLGYSKEEWLATPNFWLTVVHPDDREEAGRRALETFTAGSGGPNSFRWITKDGRTIFAEAEAVVIKDAEGKPVGMRGVTIDVTARKLVEEALRTSEQRFETTLQSIGDAVIATDGDGRVTFVNPVAEGLTGWGNAEAMGKPLEEVFVIVNEETREAVENPVSKVLREGNIVGLANHTVLIGRDGRETPIDDSGAPIRDDQDQIAGVVLVFRDITERRKAERAQEFLARSSDVLSSSLEYERTLQSVADLAVPHIGDWCGVDLLEEDGTVRQVAVAHVDPDKVHWARELRKKQPIDMSAPQGVPNVLRNGVSEIYPDIPDEMLVAAAKSEEELQLLRDIGFLSAMIVPMTARGRTIGAITFVATTESNNRYDEDDLRLAEGLANRAALAVDNARLFKAAQEELEQRRKTEEQLRSSRAQLQVILEGIADGITVQEPSGRVVFANTAAARASGFNSPEEFLKASIPDILDAYDFYDVEGRPFDLDTLPGRRALNGELNPEVTVHLRNKKTSEERWTLIRATPVFDDTGQVSLAVNFFQDITERRRADESRARLAAIVESSGDAILGKTLDGVITNWNPAAEKLYGYTAEEAIGMPVTKLLPEGREDEVPDLLKRLIRGEEVPTQETVRVRRDGQLVDVAITVSPILDASGRIVGASTIARDITERKRTEAELRRQKADIELLNSRLRRAMQETHHRVKNNLQIIAAMVDMQAMEDPQAITVDDLQRLGSQIRTLAVVHDILTHDARTSGDAQCVSAKAVIEKLLPLMEATAGDRRIHFKVEDVALPTRQGTSLALVVNELVSNAIKHGWGDVVVELVVDDDAITVDVKDDGPGFPQGFDPVVAANTGLELVQHLSRWDLGGRASYRNRPEGGASVLVRFPTAGVAG